MNLLKAVVLKSSDTIKYSIGVKYIYVTYTLLHVQELSLFAIKLKGVVLSFSGYILY